MSTVTLLNTPQLSKAFLTLQNVNVILYHTGQVQQPVQTNSGAQAVGTPPRLSTPNQPQTPQTPSSPRPQQGQVKLTLAQLTQLTQGAQVCTSFKSACHPNRPLFSSFNAYFTVLIVPDSSVHIIERGSDYVFL